MTAADLLHELADAGVLVSIAPDDPDGLDVDGSAAVLTADRLTRLRACKPDVLAILRANNAPPPTLGEPTSLHHAESRVSPVASVSDQGKGLWREDELAQLARAGTTLTNLPLVVAVKEIFADMGATVVSVKRGRRWIRRWAARLIRDARRITAGRAVAVRDAWRERVAICTVDGRLIIEDAESVALTELKTMLPSR